MPPGSVSVDSTVNRDCRARSQFVAVVGVEHAGALAGEQARRHHVVVVGELDDERGAEVGEEGDDLVERDGVGEREVVDDGQAQHEIGPDALDERQALPRPPAETRRRVGQVEHEGQHTSLALAPEVAVEAVDDEVVGVDGDDGRGAGLEGEPGEVAVVGAEVEHTPGRPGLDGCGDEPLLGAAGPDRRSAPGRRSPTTSSPACPTSAR